MKECFFHGSNEQMAHHGRIGLKRLECKRLWLIITDGKTIMMEGDEVIVAAAEGVVAMIAEATMEGVVAAEGSILMIVAEVRLV